MPFLNRIRLPFYLRQPQFPTSRNVFTKADGTAKVLSIEIQNTYQGVTDSMGKEFHRKLVVALSHDTVNIEGDRLVSGVVLDGEYDISWQDFLDNPMAPAGFQIRVTPFDETNDNCQTCDEAIQLSLADDNVGTIHENDLGSINVFTNDNICCSPIISAIMSYNTTYIDSISINELTGIVSFQLKETTPSSGADIVLATYRVTCPNGDYDEADILGTVIGSEESCEEPVNLAYTHNEDDTDSISWDDFQIGTTFDWNLYECDNLGTPIDSGTGLIAQVKTFSGLEPGSCYVFSVRRNCGDGESEYVNFEFTVTAPESLCGNFLVVADDGTGNRVSYHYSYMNCAGAISGGTVINLSDNEKCMLMDEFHNPIFFSGDAPVSYNYIEPC